MAVIWGDKWTNQHGEKPEIEWCKLIDESDDRSLAFGLNKMQDRAKDMIKAGYHAKPPSLMEFMLMCEQVHDVDFDFDGAYVRCRDRMPRGDIECWVFKKYRQKTAMMPDNEARKFHKEKCLDAYKLKQSGDPLNIQDEPQLPSPQMVHKGIDGEIKAVRTADPKIGSRLDRIMELRKKNKC